MPFDMADSFLTPNSQFYIRSHFAEPQIDVVSYRLQVGGAVRNPLSLSYDDLRGMAKATQVATLECAGNGRVFLVPPVEGAQWELGAVGNAEWTGVPLRVLMEDAGIDDAACEIIFHGADQGVPKEKPIPPGNVSYSRSVARVKALSGEVIVAYEMNGQSLPRNHGFPVRAIVPGHYGMASVKWLTGIQAVTTPFQGYWQTSDYGYWDYLDGKPVRRPLGEMSIKSQISRPRIYENVAPGISYIVRGAAWVGEADVAEIWITSDGGETWGEGKFFDPPLRYGWRRWTFEWQTPREAGPYTLMSRATDSNGVQQPDRHDPNFGTYVINHPLPIEVFVQ